MDTLDLAFRLFIWLTIFGAVGMVFCAEWRKWREERVREQCHQFAQRICPSLYCNVVDEAEDILRDAWEDWRPERMT